MLHSLFFWPLFFSHDLMRVPSSSFSLILNIQWVGLLEYMPSYQGQGARQKNTRIYRLAGPSVDLSIPVPTGTNTSPSSLPLIDSACSHRALPVLGRAIGESICFSF